MKEEFSREDLGELSTPKLFMIVAMGYIVGALMLVPVAIAVTAFL